MNFDFFIPFALGMLFAAGIDAMLDLVLLDWIKGLKARLKS